jgi:serine/threonine-protein kinase
LERIALVAGSSISDFVTRNTGVLFAENAGLPAPDQDWTTLQAFVASAARDPEIRSMVVADNSGTIRAASNATLLGQRYHPAIEERPIGTAGVALNTGPPGLVVSEAEDAGDGNGLRFVRPIHYAGADFGSVDVVMRRSALDAATADTRAMLLMFSLVVVCVVAAIAYLSGAMVTRPLARLTKALDESANCDFALRISHGRRDEFGAAFDAFNAAAGAVEPRLDGTGASHMEADLALTRVITDCRRA